MSLEKILLTVSINFILLPAQYFIFRCKNRKETPCMFHFEISISERRGLEEIIALNRNIKQTSILRNGNSCTNFKNNKFSPHTYLYYHSFTLKSISFIFSKLFSIP